MRKLCLAVVIMLVSSCFIGSSFAADKVEGKKWNFFNREPAKTTPAKAPAAKAVAVKAPVAPAARPVAKAEESVTKVINMTKEEMVADIVDALESEEDIVDVVKGLKMEKTKSGKIVYTFEGVNIENLDKDKLESLLNKVRQQKVRLHTENINRQLDTVRRIQDLNNPTGVTVPRVVTGPAMPPRIPSAPPSGSVAPQAPRAPSAPPAPPRR